MTRETIDLEALMASKGLAGKQVKLDVGAGGFSGDASFLAVDLFTEADIVATMWDIPLPDESVDAIFCCNSLEHISKFNVIPTLREFNRLLKVGGKLLIVVPDLEWACKWWLDHPDTSWNMDIIYGNQKHDGEVHRTGFTQKILFKYFGEAGGWRVRKLYFMGGENYLTLKEGPTTNSLVEHVEQKQIVAEAIKECAWTAGQYVESSLAWELSTEQFNFSSDDPLLSKPKFPEITGEVV